MTREPGDRPSEGTNGRRRVDGRENDMTTLTKDLIGGAAQAAPADARTGAVRGAASLRDLAAAALLGLGLVWLAGFAGADALHAAGHDARHASGFPCH